jgi:uracil-DNA glycosylase family 4
MNLKATARLEKVGNLGDLENAIVDCMACPRLVEHRQYIARVKRRAYLDWEYWGKPVPSFGNQKPRLLIVGLAPGAHGANRTGRIFTGDSSGDLLYRTLYSQGFCNQPESTARNDGLELQETYITAVLHCVPPQNKPLSEEIRNCQAYLLEELGLIENIQVVVALGAIAWRVFWDSYHLKAGTPAAPRPKFGHGKELVVGSNVTLIGSYHPSRQNTQTGRLSPAMFEDVFRRARQILAPDTKTD